MIIIVKDFTRGYKSRGDRQRAMTQLRKHGWNYFVFYKDTQAEFALQFSKVTWKTGNDYYLLR